MRIISGLLVVLVSLFAKDTWKALAPGLEHRVLSVTLQEHSNPIEINAIRIDPLKWELVFRGISQQRDGQPKTAREWCEKYSLTAAINAGMYNDDNQTHTGYLRDGDHINNSHNNNYKSLLAFNPKPGKDIPPARIFDLDQTGVTIDKVLEDYSTVIQNLRLIKRPGINVWGTRPDAWNEAAIAEDKHGRILFLYSETPVTMHDFNEILLSSDLEIVAAQHLEGNAPAQLYLKVGETEISLSGGEWPLPNIIGICPKAAVKKK